jgi:hypothetical protein
MMRPVYEREVHAGFAQLLTEDEARELGELLERVSASACAAAGEEMPAEPAPPAAVA